MKRKNTTAIGEQAEARVADAFRRGGYKVVDQNWRQKSCEIDLVIYRDETVYFVEVRYRSRSKYGQGYDTVDSRKLWKIHYGARVWCAQHNWQGDFQVLLASVSKQDITVMRVE